MFYGEKLKYLREEKDETLTYVANYLNMSDSLYSRYEKEIQFIPLKHLITLCNYYDVSLDYIFNLSKIKQYYNIKKDVNFKDAGKRLKEIRKELNLLQKELADVLNVARSIIGDYENGNHLISTHSLYTICNKYKISADYLLGRINEPKYLR